MKIKNIQNCPICDKQLQIAQDKDFNFLYGASVIQKSVQKAYQLFTCTSPLVSDPLHYYIHVIRAEDSDWIIYQKFSLDLGTKYVLFSNNYEKDISLICTDKDRQDLEMPVLLIPDFPNLESLKSKIRLLLAFG